MNKEVGLKEFAIAVNSDPKRDIIVNAMDLAVEPGILENHPIRLHTSSGVLDRSDTSQHAAEQLFGYVGSGFISYGRDLIRAREFDLLNRNLQDRFRDVHADKRFLVRGIGRSERSSTRAVLSDSYRRMDTDKVFDAIMPIIMDKGRYQGIGGGRSTTRDYMKFVERSASLQITDARGRRREFSIGFVFSNSEVGSGATMFELFVTDHYCQNGCIFSKQLLAKAKFNHRGPKLESDINGLIDDEIEKSREIAILGGIKKAAMTAASKDGREKIQSLLQQSMTPIDQKPSLIIDQVAKNLNIKDSTRDRIEREFFDDGNRNAFGVQAAITKVAQSVESLDERRELERAGGTVLEYSPATWKAIEAMSA